jgi:hypothetical protein
MILQVDGFGLRFALSMHFAKLDANGSAFIKAVVSTIKLPCHKSPPAMILAAWIGLEPPTIFDSEKLRNGTVAGKK